MAETKKLLLAIETTAAMGRYWPTILKDYLQKVIRSFNGDSNTDPANRPNVEMGFVTFNDRGAYSNCMVGRSGWTKNVDYFIDMLKGMAFNGGGFSDVGIAEGLSDVLMMYPFVHGNENYQNVGLNKHCILIAASNPYPLPTPVYVPPECIEVMSDGPLFDAETVAKCFKQCLVSLSVICPRNLPKLKAIYNSGKRNPSSVDPTFDNIVKDPNYMLLISEDFVEACDTLSQPEIIDLTQSQPAITESSTVFSSMASNSYSQLSTSQEMTSSTRYMTSPLPVAKTVTSTSPTTTSTESQRQPVLQEARNVSSSSSSMASPQTGLLSVSQRERINQSRFRFLARRKAKQAESANLSQTMPTILGNDNVAANVGPTQQTSSEFQSEPGFVKLWEGNLTCEKEGQQVIITKLEGYGREIKDSQSLAHYWPFRMQIYTVIPEEEVKNKNGQAVQIFNGKVDSVSFKAMNESYFLQRCQERKLYIFVKLPSQTLMMYPSGDNPRLLAGMLFPKESVKFGPWKSDVDGTGGGQMQFLLEGNTS